MDAVVCIRVCGLHLFSKAPETTAPVRDRFSVNDAVKYYSPGRRRDYRRIRVTFAEVAELADAHGSGPCTRKGVGGRVPSSAPLVVFWGFIQLSSEKFFLTNFPTAAKIWVECVSMSATR